MGHSERSTSFVKAVGGLRRIECSPGRRHPVATLCMFAAQEANPDRPAVDLRAFRDALLQQEHAPH